MRFTNDIKFLKALCNNYKADIVDGPFGSNMKRSDYIGDGIPVLKIQNVKPFKIEMKKMDFVTQAKYDELRRHSYKKGDIVMTKLGDPLGASAIVEDIDDGLIVADLVRIRAQNIDTKYLCYHLNSPTTIDFINSQQKGSTRPRVQISVVRDLPIYAPPPHEQHRIVAILDEVFGAIAKVKANAEQNLKNAKGLFESYLQSVFESRGGGWVTETLEALLNKGWILSHLDGNHGGDYPRKEEFESTGIPYISANCLKGTNIDFSLAKFLSPERALTIRKGVAINDDVLFAHNATVGPVALLKMKEEKVILGTSLTYYRCNREHILPEYLANYMRSKEFKSQYEIVMRQSTRNQVPITKQREFYHIIPPIELQKKIVVKLDILLNNTQKLVTTYQQKINDLEELQKSILQKAFSGELKPRKSIAV